MTATEAALVARAQRGDRTAYDRLIDAYQRPIYHLALRYCGHEEDARELAQETFIRAWLKLGTFRLGAPFRPWLYQVATRVCLNHVERRPPPTRSLEPRQPDERPFDPPADPAEEPGRQVPARLLAEQVRAAVAELPPAYRLVMLLYHVEQMTYPEIAAACGLPLGTVKTHLHRARGRLREQLATLLPEHTGAEP